MIIRPISDLRNRFSEVEKDAKSGEPVFLTKNGYGSLVVLDIDQYEYLINNVDALLLEADEYAKNHPERFTKEEAFAEVSKFLNEL